LTLSGISRELHIPTSTAFAILRTLAHSDAVVVSAKRYTIGPAAFYVGSAYVSNSPLYRAVWTDLVRLADELHLSANLTVAWEQHHLVLAVHSGLGIPGLPPGSRLPLNAGAYGKAYGAWIATRGSADAKARQASVPKGADHVQIQRLGYATDNGELLAGSAGVAAGITDRFGYAGTVGLWSRPASDLVERVTFPRAGERLARLATHASLILGDPAADEPWHEEH
jgi:DNA-binding IclR family transcriptional regulator